MRRSSLPEPEIISCYFIESFDPRLLAMQLAWPDASPFATKEWQLPGGLKLSSALPTHFGIEVHRVSSDCYAARVLWDDTCLAWVNLSRGQLLDTCLPDLLTSLGSDLEYMLDQPVLPEPAARPISRVG